MNYLLAMNIVQCGGYLGAEAGNGLGRQRQFRKLRAQELADNQLHDDVGLSEPPDAMKRGTCGPDNFGQNHLLGFEADNVDGVCALLQAQDFINKGGSSAARDTRQNAAVAASGSSSSRRKPATTSPGCKPLPAIRSTSRQEAKAEHGR